ncbi:MAG: RAMP superfamily protein [Cyanobacteriota bacterium]|nr:RAMP superfamily protein [Cyanobacteriota bacterium]
MIVYKLKMKLLSDTTFGRGDGVAGLVDQEIEHDPNGFPYLRGRTLKGLLSEECDNLIAVLSPDIRQHWEKIASGLFGKPGSSLETIAQMHVGDACLPRDLREVIGYQIQWDNKLSEVDILESLTTIRRQTAINSATGVAEERSLRSIRVILRDLEFTAPLSFEIPPNEDTLTVLSVGVLALRRVGSVRNRGLGYVQCRLFDAKNNEITTNYLERFGQVAKES